MLIPSIFIKKNKNIIKSVFGFTVFMIILLIYFKNSHIFAYVIKLINKILHYEKNFLPYHLFFCFN